MSDYNFKEIEAKWQKTWKENPGYNPEDFSEKPKFYALVEFPYPSGAGLHLGHAFTNIIVDILARKKRLSGFNVLYPMGWDAFGLPTENYAIKTGIQPSVATESNIDTFKKQMDKLALAYDWDREVNTTDPNYYKWTQWIFLKFFEKGLAFKAEAPVGWCPSCKTILANEEIVDGKCERCGTQAEQRSQKQWMMRITEYADRLADELDLVDYTTAMKLAQRNWIGKSQGMIVKFELNDKSYEQSEIEVFTTRIDTILGVSFICLAPEHPVSVALSKTNKQISDYLESVKKRTERERQETVKDKTGVETGLMAINPANGENVPVWISDFVLPNYGTGAIMGVPAYDERDNDFASNFDLPINQSDMFEDIKSLGDKAREETTYHLRDWVFSRQHYWGEPIPIIECEKCGLVPVPDDQLPVTLPEVDKYQPTETGESPLANVNEWVNTQCPKCGGQAKRETDTMPNWAGSSWYFLRYCDPNNGNALADLKKLEYWMPVDLYVGGSEHITLHVLYSRFWHKFLNDIGVAPGKEPYKARRHHGMILAEDGTKMSKSKGNVINPDDMVNKYGSDTLRTYLAFMGPYDNTMPWSMKGIEGSKRFITRIWRLFQMENKFSESTSEELLKLLNETIKKVGEDIDALKHNTAVSALMILIKKWEEKGQVMSKSDSKKFLVILSPIAPHISEELWQFFDDSKSSVHIQEWPQASLNSDEETTTIVVMVDGKQRSILTVDKSIDWDNQEEISALAQKDENVTKHLQEKTITKEVYVKGKVMNFVTR